MALQRCQRGPDHWPQFYSQLKITAPFALKIGRKRNEDSKGATSVCHHCWGSCWLTRLKRIWSFELVNPRALFRRRGTRKGKVEKLTLLLRSLNGLWCGRPTTLKQWWAKRGLWILKQSMNQELNKILPWKKKIPKSSNLGLEPETFLEICINSILFKPVGLNHRFCPSGDILQYLETFLVVTSRGRVLLASCEKRPGIVLSILQHTGQPPATRHCSVDSTEESLC